MHSLNTPEHGTAKYLSTFKILSYLRKNSASYMMMCPYVTVELFK